MNENRFKGINMDEVDVSGKKMDENGRKRMKWMREDECG